MTQVLTEHREIENLEFNYDNNITLIEQLKTIYSFYFKHKQADLIIPPVGTFYFFENNKVLFCYHINKFIDIFEKCFDFNKLIGTLYCKQKFHPNVDVLELDITTADFYTGVSEKHLKDEFRVLYKMYNGDFEKIINLL